jgi:hypothetical protein
MQSAAVTVELSTARTAPPELEAIFAIRVQLVTMAVEAPPAKIAPPQYAVLDVIVQSVAVMVASSVAWTAPP